MEIHFVDVGQGNMVVVLFPDGDIMVYDCNITEDNEEEVFEYLENIMPKNEIDVFVNSHRDADHMRGIRKLHERYPIGTLWDSGVSGNTEAPEYQEYMDFRRSMSNSVYEVEPNQYWKRKPFVKILNGKREGLSDTNAQSVVIHIDAEGSSLMLTGDTDANVWKNYIMPESSSKVKSSVLLASHHGSIKFFDNPGGPEDYYEKHLLEIDPEITIISVGENPHGHPDKKALEMYEKYSSGSDKGNKIFRTDSHGNIKLKLKGGGKWVLNKGQ